jgi:hypothetical protein
MPFIAPIAGKGKSLLPDWSSQRSRDGAFFDSAGFTGLPDIHGSVACKQPQYPHALQKRKPYGVDKQA